jgi:hypothetical protein
MSTPAPLHDSSAKDAAAQFHKETPRQVVKALVDAANDPPRPDLESDDYRNPLWTIAIAMVCVFGTIAALLALS